MKTHGPAVPYRQHNRILRQTIADDEACASIPLLEEFQIEREAIIGRAHAEQREAGCEPERRSTPRTPGAPGNARVERMNGHRARQHHINAIAGSRNRRYDQSSNGV